MIDEMNNIEIDEIGAGGKSSGASIPEVVAEAVVGFVIGVLEAWTDGK